MKHNIPLVKEVAFEDGNYKTITFNVSDLKTLITEAIVDALKINQLNQTKQTITTNKQK